MFLMCSSPCFQLTQSTRLLFFFFNMQDTSTALWINQSFKAEQMEDRKYRCDHRGPKWCCHEMDTKLGAWIYSARHLTLFGSALSSLVPVLDGVCSPLVEIDHLFMSRRNSQLIALHWRDFITVQSNWILFGIIFIEMRVGWWQGFCMESLLNTCTIQIHYFTL